MTHVHIWQPIPGEMGQYACTGCPATGYRGRSGIIEHKTRPEPKQRWTAKDHNTQAGRVGRSPLEDWQGNERDE